MVILITTEKEFYDILKKSIIEMKLLVVDFFTTWCGPCQMFAPEFERLSQTYSKDTYFIKIDCDSLSELAGKQNISRLPTLKGFLNAKKAFLMEGAINVKLLIQEIESHIVQPCLKSLYQNKPDIKPQSYLLKLSNNIINFPTEEKYRQLKFSNKSVQENLLAHEGIMDCLLSLGFNKEDGRLHMPLQTPIEKLKAFSKQLSLLSQSSPETIRTPQTNNANVDNSDQGVSQLKSRKIADVPMKYTAEEIHFLNTIKSRRKHIQLYENIDLMNIVNALVDIDSYKSSKMSEERILEKLLRWFKYDFFSWFNPPVCSTCSKPFVAIGSQMPTPEESKWLSGRVEVYKCQDCRFSNEEFRFPRYNHPEKLLITRTGRCGEWANCFSMILRTFIGEGLFEKARFVMDWSDHVWCEIYAKLDNESTKRWIHVDPCECAYNTPFVYQVGWKKRIDYVIGVTLVTGDVQDITWRYTNDFKTTLANRKLIREEVLIQNLVTFHKESKTDVKEIISELVTFISTTNDRNQVSEMEKIGRTTGSVEWRQQRGELGEEPYWRKVFTGQSIIPTSLELANNCVHIQYNCSTDSYSRPCDCEPKNAISGQGEILSSSSASSGTSQRKTTATKTSADLLSTNTDNWQSLASSWKNIKRKVEYDWQIVYLARNPDSPPDANGEIRWTIDLTGTDKVIGEISVFASSAEFHNASVRWRLESGDRQVAINGFLTSSDFSDCVTVDLIACLETGTTDSGSTNSWQHTQLCRQKSNDYEVKTLQIKVELHDGH